MPKSRGPFVDSRTGIDPALSIQTSGDEILPLFCKEIHQISRALSHLRLYIRTCTPTSSAACPPRLPPASSNNNNTSAPAYNAQQQHWQWQTETAAASSPPRPERPRRIVRSIRRKSAPARIKTATAPSAAKPSRPRVWAGIWICISSPRTPRRRMACTMQRR